MRIPLSTKLPIYNSALSRYLKLQVRVWSYLAIGVIIFMIARISMFLYFFDTSAQHSLKDVSILYLLGLLYDVQAMAFLLSPILAGGLVLACIKNYRLVYVLAGLLVLTTVFALNVVNFYYYQYFNNHIDSNIFQIIEGQASATLIYIYEKYPLFLFGCLLVIFVIFCFKFLIYIEEFIQNIQWRLSVFLKIVIIAISVFLYVSAMRCSIAGFSLYHNGFSVISSSQLINQLVENSVASLYDAYINLFDFKSLSNFVSDHDAAQAYNRLFLKNKSPNEFNLKDLYTKTAEKMFSSQHPKPNVIFVQMESFGQNFLLFSNSKNNFLGKLTPYFNNDFIFKNFLSSANSTQQSLGHLIMNTPHAAIMDALHCKRALSSSVANPFKKAGYNTIFITAGSSHWSNLNNFLPEQNFDYVFDLTDILKKYPQAETEPWGVYDEYAYSYAYEFLKQAHTENKPTFIYIQTITNHPPYSVPKHYHGTSLQIPSSLHKETNMSAYDLHKMAETYQYANNALGDFIEQIEHSNFADKTIIGASGDHNQREFMFNGQGDSALGQRYAVPFYLHIPDGYQQHLIYNPNRIGSHKDIFPTLFELALSNAAYLNLGENLFSPDPKIEFGYNVSAVLFPEGIILPQNNEHVFYPWLDNSKNLVKRPFKPEVQQWL